MERKVKNAVSWIDRHPRTGWYIASYGLVIITAHLIFDVLMHFVS